jgi:adenylate kinase
MRIVLLGAPGAGKGTQAEVISREKNIPTISTGNIIRDALKSGSELGKKARKHIEAGHLVPDDIVIDVIRERLSQPDCKNGFILDGFPRTIPQAEALERMGVHIDRVIEIDVDDEVIARRMSGRRVCPSCGTSYHIEHKQPKKRDVCDNCGDTLVQREDDRPETVRERLRVYHEQTAPLKNYYATRNKLYVVKGQEDVNDTIRLTLAALKS